MFFRFCKPATHIGFPGNFSSQIIGVRVGKVWGCEGFMPEFPQTSPKKLFWRSHKKTSCVFFFEEKKKSNSNVFRQSVSFITQWEQRCRKVCARIFQDFSRIFKDFARIFDKLKLLWVRFHARLLHYGHKSFTKRSVFMSQSFHCDLHKFTVFKTTSTSQRCTEWFAICTDWFATKA